MSKYSKTGMAETGNWQRRVIIGAVLAASLACALAYFNKKHPEHAERMIAGLVQITEWVSDHRHRLGKQIDKVKQLSQNPEPPPIHFEFYTELPKMKVNVLTAENNLNTLPDKIVKRAQSKKNESKKVPIISAEELEQEFSNQVIEKKPTKKRVKA